VAVTVIGLLTILFGGVYAAQGGILIFAGDAMANDPAGKGFLEVLGGLLAVIGGTLLLQGVPMILAGVGVLLRRQWGRILTLLMAGLTVLWGLLLLSLSDRDAGYVAFGAAEILYAIVAVVVLFKHGAEFSRQGVSGTASGGVTAP
jgi:hypothetical protein